MSFRTEAIPKPPSFLSAVGLKQAVSETLGKGLAGKAGDLLKSWNKSDEIGRTQIIGQLLLHYLQKEETRRSSSSSSATILDHAHQLKDKVDTLQAKVNLAIFKWNITGDALESLVSHLDRARFQGVGAVVLDQNPTEINRVIGESKEKKVYTYTTFARFEYSTALNQALEATQTTPRQHSSESSDSDLARISQLQITRTATPPETDIATQYRDWVNHLLNLATGNPQEAFNEFHQAEPGQKAEARKVMTPEEEAWFFHHETSSTSVSTQQPSQEKIDAMTPQERFQTLQRHSRSGSVVLGVSGLTHQDFQMGGGISADPEHIRRQSQSARQSFETEQQTTPQ